MIGAFPTNPSRRYFLRLVSSPECVRTTVPEPPLATTHSLGGLLVKLYASTYPKDVAGLVLIDALSEGLRDAETLEQWATQRKLIEGDVKENLALYPALERIAVDRSFGQARARSATAFNSSRSIVCGPRLGSPGPINDCGR